LAKEKKGRGQFSTVSLPTSLVEEVQKIVDELRYWPSKTDFIREATLEKIEKTKRKPIGE